MDAGGVAMLMALLAGTVAGIGSVPHCAAMCGPLAAFACGRAPGSGVGAAARYQLGRFVAYAGLGAAAGALGQAVTAYLTVPWGRAVVSWTLAAALLWTAGRLWRLGAHPRRAASERGLVGLGSARARPGLFARLARLLPRDPAVVGVLTALLPCGALYAAIAIAAGAGSVAGGALAMMGFSLASSVGVFGAGWVASRVRSIGSPGAVRALAVAIAVGALVLALRPVPTLRGEPVLCHPVAAVSSAPDVRGRDGG